MGSGWGAHVYPWLIHVNVWQKPPQYCKVISLQFKKKLQVLYFKFLKTLVTFYALGVAWGSSQFFKK